MMKRLVAWLFFLGLAALAVVLVAPGFIDWNRHKDRIVGQISLHLQRKVDVGGDVSLRLLPRPELMLEQVAVANTAEGGTGPLMTLGRLGLRVKFAPLLQGRVEVESLDLLDPVINLEVLGSGKGNWAGLLQGGPAETLGQAAGAVSLNRVRVENGTLYYTNRANGTKLKLEGLDLSVAAATLLGPYEIGGSLEYRGAPVKVDIRTERYSAPAPLPLEISFLPAAGGMPEVRLDGVVDFRSGLDIQGELSVEKGNLISLLGDGAFGDAAFLHDPADLRGSLEWKGGLLSLSDVRAKFGQKGELKGKASVQFSRDKRPFVHLDAEGRNLVLTDKSGAPIRTPAAFSGALRFRGKNLTWGGNRIAAAEIDADFAPREWKIKSAQAGLSASSQVSFSGVAAPEAGSGSYTLLVETEDLGKLAGVFAPPENNPLKFLGEAGLVRKFTLSGNLDISPLKASLFNIEATAEGKTKISGVINVDRTLQKPNFTARLNIADWDADAYSAPALGAFLRSLMTAEADVELAGKNMALGGLKIPGLSLKGKIDAQGIWIEDLHGTLPQEGSFFLSGRRASFAHDAATEVSYALKAEQAENVAKALGFALPPPLAWENADLKGTIKGGASSYTFSAEGAADGGEVSVDGTVEPDAEGKNFYQAALRLKHKNADKALDALGLPVGGLMDGGGAFEFSGALKGGRERYKIDRIQAKIGGESVSGYLERKAGGKVAADLIAGKLDLDGWLAEGWPLPHDLSLTLRADDLLWQGQHIGQPQMNIEAGIAAVKISGLQGKLWGGTLNAEMSFESQGPSSWSSGFRGSLKQADLTSLISRLGLQGFSTWASDVDFDLASSDNTLAAATGRLSVVAGSLTVENFSFDKLGALISQWTAVPAGLQQPVDDSIRRNGATTFKEVRGRFRLDKGRIGIENLTLATAHGSMDVEGSTDTKKGSYEVSGKLVLKETPGMGPITVRRTSGAQGYAVDAGLVADFVVKNNPVPVEVAPAPLATEAAPPGQNGENGVVGGILQRLEEEGKGSGKKQP